MDAQIERHQPLITARLVFKLKEFPPPPTISARMEFPSISVPRQYERSPTPDEVRTSSEYSSTPKRRYTISKSNDVDLDSTARRAATPTKRPTPINTQRTVTFGGVDDDMGSPLMTDESDGLDSEEDGKVSTKVPKPPGTVGRPQSGGYNLQDKLGWNDTTYQSILVSFC
jgi:hypothetical protein